MSNATKIGMGGKEWAVGYEVVSPCDVIIPIDQLEGMSLENIGRAVTSALLPAAAYMAKQVIRDWEYIKHGPDDHLARYAALLEPYIYRDDFTTRAYGWLTAELDKRHKRQHSLPSRVQRTGYVYLAYADTGHYKIGLSVDPRSRIKHFDTKMPVEVKLVHVIETDDMQRLEGELHRRYEGQRVTGEWFELSQDDVAFIQSIKSRDYGERVAA